MDATLVIAIAAVILIIIVLLVLDTFHVVPEEERGVVFRFGRFRRVARPGLRAVIPLGIDRMVRIDVRMQPLDVEPQDVITLDNVPCRVGAAIVTQVIDPRLAATAVADYKAAATQVVGSALRGVAGQVTLKVLLSERERVQRALADIIERDSEAWGVRVSSVEVRRVELSEELQRALGRQAEAERMRVATLIAAKAELEAANTLRDAAGVLGSTPEGLQLRYIQALNQLRQDGTVVLIPVPGDLVQTLRELQARTAEDVNVAAPETNGTPALEATPEHSDS